jgi:hypothetical protein
MWDTTRKEQSKEKAPKKKAPKKFGPKRNARKEKKKGTCGPKHQTPHIPFGKIPSYI